MSDRTCTLPDCPRPYAAKGVCLMHYKRRRKGIPDDVPVLGHRKAAGCTADECDRPHHSGGFCTMHYQRVRHGYSEQVRRYGCLVDECAEPHFGSGYCRAHYSRHIRSGAGERTCPECGTTYTRPLGKSGSYVHCPACADTAPTRYTRVRRERLAVNNADMTDADRSTSAEYREVIAADPCVYCGRPAVADDHIVPVVDGGSDRWDNLAPTCKSCNSTKGTRTVLDMLLVLST